jgi:hypothetical protein
MKTLLAIGKKCLFQNIVTQIHNPTRGTPFNIQNTIYIINPLNAKLNPICHLLALLGGATIVDVGRLRVNSHISGEFFFQIHHLKKLEASPPTVEHKVEHIQNGNFPQN